MENAELYIGFPFIYYNEFMLDCPIPNSDWNILNLFLDCVIIWILTIVVYKLIKKNALQQRTELKNKSFLS